MRRNRNGRARNIFQFNGDALKTFFLRCIRYRSTYVLCIHYLFEWISYFSGTRKPIQRKRVVSMNRDPSSIDQLIRNRMVENNQCDLLRWVFIVHIEFLDHLRTVFNICCFTLYSFVRNIYKPYVRWFSWRLKFQCTSIRYYTRVYMYNR